ncbi:aminotransferase class III-fold pyridoxal phosphate-dependent enzyme [Ramlibacter sp. RBP-2]|uniref:Aminotransferase class III-fold pyridoxal phosphate-dependent enzyme n=1 Tax=Ramlibacter lithotrophicus TaxID=2606681 RepID=A0A7X6DI86_9BURK|nr:aminotransferase [Ramlibacter lithotrophicus]NKE67636.1 aminotransferase class III-fold pyridoxal phosphate-dependent enzyme [Ramlibacter lithotrophicus]
MDAPTLPISPAGRSDLTHHLHPYTQLRQLEREGPLVIVRGDGVNVFDEHGNGYIEGMAGLWCASLGFSEKRLADAAYRQMTTLPYYHSFSGKVPGPVAALVDKLIEWAPVPMGRVLFANSGSEANDTAFKLVRYYNNARGRPLKKKIIARNKGYHGVTMAAASLSGLPMMHQHFDLPLPDVVRVSCPHFYQFGLPGETEAQFVDRLAQELEDTIQREGPETVAAFIAEPVQGAGGVVVPPAGYFAKVQAILKKHDILLIADEVITGFGRLGQPFGTQVFDLKPDMITVAKMLTSAYVPMSALYVSDQIYQAVADASAAVGVFGHGYTYSGHPLACAVALETLRIYEDDRIVDHVREVAPRLQDGLRKFASHPLVGQARGLGLIGALELAADPAQRKPFEPARGVGAYFVRRAQAHGLIVRVLGGDIIAFSPPLVITEAEIDAMLARTELALADTWEWVRTWR